MHMGWLSIGFELVIYYVPALSPVLHFYSLLPTEVVTCVSHDVECLYF
jgi:hypothetical protein